MTCDKCHGAGNILRGVSPIKYCACPKCVRSGVTIQYGPRFAENKDRRK